MFVINKSSPPLLNSYVKSMIVIKTIMNRTSGAIDPNFLGSYYIMAPIEVASFLIVIVIFDSHNGMVCLRRFTSKEDKFWLFTRCGKNDNNIFGDNRN